MKAYKVFENMTDNNDIIMQISIWAIQNLDIWFNKNEFEKIIQRAEEENDDLITIINEQNSKGGLFILSTTENSYLHKQLSDTFYIIRIRKTYKTSVGQHLKKNHQEIIITNIKTK